MRAPRRRPFDPPPPAAIRIVPAASVMIGSLATIWPLVASFPVLPPLGLMLLVGWRLTRPGTFTIWAPLPLGLFDDLFSGQPLGSAMLLWTMCFLAIDLIDQRLAFPDFRQDWMVAAGAIGFCLIGGRLIAAPFGAHVDTVLVLQIMASVLLYPLAARLCVRLDRRYRGA